jgi:sigma-B regulation protein RsbU (phosphoserine phosphatase)
MLELKDKLLAHDELEAGRAVQTALMPDRSPDVPGWTVWLYTRTANEVGGDLVDFQKIDDRRYRISLADVAGKGLSAALVTAKLQATIRAFSSEPIALAGLVGRVNRIFFRDKVRSTFASFVYVEVDSDTADIRLVNAGHLPPLLLRKGTIEEFPKGDPAIGVIPDTVFTLQERTVESGDVLLVYSDGLSEAKNRTGDFFGGQRVAEMLSSLGNFDATLLGERLLETVDLFVGDAPMYDDLSLIILKRTG